MIAVNSVLSLQPIAPQDSTTLFELMERIYSPVYAHLWPDGGHWYLARVYQPAKVAAELGEPGAAYYFVCWHGRVVGILRYLTAALPEQPASRALKLHRLYLDPAVHGHGIGRRLMDWVEDYARDTGHRLIWLEAMDSQQQALGFYRSCGFSLAGTFRLPFERMYPHFRGMCRLCKELRP